MRSVAELVGVTTPSIYRHFKDKEDLMDAVCEEVFETLAAALEQAAASAKSPLERLFAQGRAYLDFALANPEEYRIVFMTGGFHPKNTDDFLTDRCFSQLVGTIVACTEAGIFPDSPDGPAGLGLEFFATAHGFASLLVCKPWLPWGGTSAFLERLMRMCAGGAALAERLEGQPEPVVAERLAALAGNGQKPGPRGAQS